MSKRFAGIMAPVPTPFGSDGSLALDRFAAHLERLLDSGLSGFVILGSNGEANLLTEAEKIDLVRLARSIVPDDRPLLIGTGLESTEATCELTRRVADLGADAALVLTPSFYRPAPGGLRRHFERVADAASIPVLLYNVPKFTNLNLDVEIVQALANHPNIVGMKDSAGDIGQLIALRERTPSAFRIFIGADQTLLAGLVHGMDGAILALANVAPRLCVAEYEAVQRGDWARAREIAARLAPVGRVVVAKYGIPGLKAALDELGAFGGKPRLPLVPLDEPARREIRDVLEQADLL